jgi:hypothetical protein
MNSTEELTGASNKTDESVTTFEDWAEQFRSTLKQRQESTGQLAASTEEEENEKKKCNKFLFFVTILAGVLLVTFAFSRIL